MKNISFIVNQTNYIANHNDFQDGVLWSSEVVDEKSDEVELSCFNCSYFVKQKECLFQNFVK